MSKDAYACNSSVSSNAVCGTVKTNRDSRYGVLVEDESRTNKGKGG